MVAFFLNEYYHIIIIEQYNSKGDINGNNINLVQLKTGKTKKGIYNIQHINSFHSKLKKFIEYFNGVSTKYLNNCLLWNSLVNVKGDSIQDKVNTLLRTAIATPTTVKYRELSSRPVIPLLV